MKEEQNLNSNKYKPIVIAFGASIALGAGTASAVDLQGMANKAKDMAKGVIAGEARDMQGNKVVINPETGFAYGGDEMGIYAGGKVGTGAKDPTVCGTFSSASCSIAHLKK
jgi:hypothetical protein